MLAHWTYSHEESITTCADDVKGPFTDVFARYNYAKRAPSTDSDRWRSGREAKSREFVQDLSKIDMVVLKTRPCILF